MLRSVFFIASLAIILFTPACKINKEAQKSKAKLLQRGKIHEDTSYVYWLPYKEGTAHWLVQGYYSPFTHRNRVALDFKMKKGTEVYAMRGGVVTRMNEKGEKGGLKPAYRQEANYIIIRHDDGSSAGYWHLKKNGVLVRLGDTIRKGQLIGLSGNTGYTAFPHLHIIVWHTNENGKWEAIATRFLTRKKTRYLRPLRFYRSQHE
ncbi:MAG: peptidoglycan DD-metalloendopeptidase family protein [Terrimonas sp.]|nr:peptidoglycan DD-metalloendopeptidase family protein [Terrimonas sp.]